MFNKGQYRVILAQYGGRLIHLISHIDIIFNFKLLSEKYPCFMGSQIIQLCIHKCYINTVVKVIVLIIQGVVSVHFVNFYKIGDYVLFIS